MVSTCCEWDPILFVLFACSIDWDQKWMALALVASWCWHPGRQQPSGAVICAMQGHVLHSISGQGPCFSGHRPFLVEMLETQYRREA